MLSHFDGGRPGVITVTPGPDGTLKVVQLLSRPGAAAAQTAAYTGRRRTLPRGNAYAADATPDGRYASTLTAYRQEVAQAKGFRPRKTSSPTPRCAIPTRSSPSSSADFDGNVLSNEDPRFKNKVVLAVVTGTWCPNCHDEAQYLVQLDKKYRDKGLAIVALDFEEPEQQASQQRERAFIKKYGVKYTYLNAGAPAEMWEKVPQLNHLDTWPATVFIGRDGKVAAVHSGFASPASGEFHDQLKQEFTARIEKLLAQRVASDEQPERFRGGRQAGAQWLLP